MKRATGFAAVLTAVMLLITMTGCTSEKAGVSYDKIICTYSTAPCFGAEYECFSTNYTVYADNKVVVSMGPVELWSADGDVVIDDLGSKEFAITEEQKQSVIKAIEANRVWTLGDCSNHSIMDGSSAHIELYDKNGEVIYTCGGLNPTNLRFGVVSNIVCSLVPGKEVAELRLAAEEKSMAAADEFERAWSPICYEKGITYYCNIYDGEALLECAAYYIMPTEDGAAVTVELTDSMNNKVSKEYKLTAEQWEELKKTVDYSKIWERTRFVSNYDEDTVIRSETIYIYKWDKCIGCDGMNIVDEDFRSVADMITELCEGAEEITA